MTACLAKPFESFPLAATQTSVSQESAQILHGAFVRLLGRLTGLFLQPPSPLGCACRRVVPITKRERYPRLGLPVGWLTWFSLLSKNALETLRHSAQY